MLNVVESIELCHPVRPDTELADRLRAAEQQHGQQRNLTEVERQGLVEHLAISNGGAAMRRQDEADKSLRLQLVERRPYLPGVSGAPGTAAPAPSSPSPLGLVALSAPLPSMCAGGRSSTGVVMHASVA